MHHLGLIPGQRARALIVLLSCALILSLTVAMPVSAAGPLKLTAASADPTSGTAGDRFTFSVTYVSKDRIAPAFVRVLIDGKAHELSAVDSNEDPRLGARYRTRLALKEPGRHTYSFAARDEKGRDVTLPGGTVTVKPKPKPKPTGESAPKPTSQTTSPTRSRTGPRATPEPTPDAGTESASASLLDPADALAAALLRSYSGPWPDDPTDGLGSLGAPAGPIPPGPGRGGAADGGPRGSGGRGAPTSIAALVADLPGLGSDEWLVLAARSAVISTATAAVVAMALFTFRRRRRDDEDPFEPPARDDATESPDPTEARPAGEAAMPRWRRPSLQAARKADPGTDLAAIEAQRLTFAAAAVSNERRRIRYRMVRLSDSPDEIMGQEIGRLDEGDEVELLEREGLYWQVRTPLGQVGWVHKMTLGDVVAAKPAEVVLDNDDDDVLAAFNEAQARRAFEPYADPVLGEGLAAKFIRERGAG